MSSSNAIGNFDLDLVKIRKPLSFPDGTIQDTAYTGSTQNPAIITFTPPSPQAGGYSTSGILTLYTSPALAAGIYQVNASIALTAVTSPQTVTQGVIQAQVNSTAFASNTFNNVTGTALTNLFGSIPLSCAVQVTQGQTIAITVTANTSGGGNYSYLAGVTTYISLIKI